MRAHALFAHGAAARRTLRLDSAEASLSAAEQLHRHLGMMQWVALCLAELSCLAADRDDRALERSFALAAVHAVAMGLTPGLWRLRCSVSRSRWRRPDQLFVRPSFSSFRPR